eukprot:5007849-Alexandrium_andersonii.AAC.1
MLGAECISPTQLAPLESIVIASSASSSPPAAGASPSAQGPPELSPTQPFSPERGLLTPGRSRTAAAGDGRAAPLPPPGSRHLAAVLPSPPGDQSPSEAAE